MIAGVPGAVCPRAYMAFNFVRTLVKSSLGTKKNPTVGMVFFKIHMLAMQ